MKFFYLTLVILKCDLFILSSLSVLGGYIFLQIKLADKQAAVEKLQWEAITSNKKVEKLQEDLTTVEGEISCFMSLIEGLARTDMTPSDADFEFVSYTLEENHESVSYLYS